MADVLKNSCKATTFNYDTHDRKSKGSDFTRRLAGQSEGLEGVAGRTFSAHLPCQ
jgi:hypothetical protein